MKEAIPATVIMLLIIVGFFIWMNHIRVNRIESMLGIKPSDRY